MRTEGAPRVYEDVCPSLQGRDYKEPRIVASRGRNPDNPSDRTAGSPAEQRLEPNSGGTPNALTNVQKDNWLAQNQSIRRLTPTECERLQGFPDGWTSDGLTKDGEQVAISDTQRYKCLGNAVTTNVIEAIGERLLG
jgi:DNA (cytosine-5)-methyltransferase 1